MTTERGNILLPIARAAISHVLNVPHTADETAPWLAEHGACFVTLTQSGELRGCIGSLQAHRPLLADVKSNAVSAALHDPRFTPLCAEELDITTVEISLPAATAMDVRARPMWAQIRPKWTASCSSMVTTSTFCRRYGNISQPRQFMAQSDARPGCPMTSGKKAKLSRDND
jgi:hypothetical protein